MKVENVKKNCLGTVASVCLASMLILVFLPIVVFGQEGKFQGLGDIPGGIFFSKAFGVSPDGALVVGQSNSGRGMEAFVWTQHDGMVGLGDFDEKQAFSLATAVSNNGLVVGRGRHLTQDQAFRWTRGEGLGGLVNHAEHAVSTEALALSANGQRIVGNIFNKKSSTKHKMAFLWTDGSGIKELGDLPGGEEWSLAHAVSADGQVVVGRSKSSNGIEAFYWTEEKGMVPLGDLSDGDFFSTALGISADGKVIVGFGTTRIGVQAFRWTESTGMVWLGEVPGVKAGSVAFDASKDGSVIVGTITYGEAGDEAFMWDSKSGFRHLATVLKNDYALRNELKGWTLEQALGVSDDGSTIVGFGVNPEGKREAWIARIKNVHSDADHNTVKSSKENNDSAQEKAEEKNN